MKTLTLVRGVPGSGKTTLAKEMVDANTDHFEADMFFTDKEGNYKFNPKKLSKAHRWCQKKARKALKKGRNVVVANTFIRRHELQPYLEMAIDCNAEIHYITCSGDYKNTHGVPQKKVDDMRDNIEAWTTALAEHAAKKIKGE